MVTTCGRRLVLLSWFEKLLFDELLALFDGFEIFKFSLQFEIGITLWALRNLIKSLFTWPYMMVLLGYRSDDKRLKVWRRVK